jgi:hypothetical protein
VSSSSTAGARHPRSSAIVQYSKELDLLLGITQEKLRWGGRADTARSLVLASPRLRSRPSFLFYQLYQSRPGQAPIDEPLPEGMAHLDGIPELRRGVGFPAP